MHHNSFNLIINNTSVKTQFYHHHHHHTSSSSSILSSLSASSLHINIITIIILHHYHHHLKWRLVLKSPPEDLNSWRNEPYSEVKIPREKYNDRRCCEVIIANLWLSLWHDTMIICYQNYNMTANINLQSQQPIPAITSIICPPLHNYHHHLLSI